MLARVPLHRAVLMPVPSFSRHRFRGRLRVAARLVGSGVTDKPGWL